MMDTSKKRIFSQVLFVCTLALVIAIALLYLYNMIKWGEEPDLGFHRRIASGIQTVGAVTEVGQKAGVQVGDRILEVNGKAFSNNEEFSALRHWELGKKNTYLIEREGRQFEISITNTPFGFKRVFIRSGLLFLVGLCYLLIGTLVFLMKPHRRTSWIFFLFSIIIGLFLAFFFRSGEMRPFWLGTFHILLNALIPAAFLHWAMSFPEERILIKKHPYVQLLPYLGSFCLFLRIRLATPELMGAPRIWYFILVSYITSGIIVFLISCVQSWLKSPSEIVRVRSKMVLLGVAISVSVPLSEAIINMVFHVHLVPSFNYYLPFFVAFPIAVAYSIIKHNLFDIDATIRRSFGYILINVGIAGIYTLLRFIPTFAFGKFDLAESPIFPLILILVAFFFFNLTRNRVQKFIDRVFYRLEYDYQETVRKISESMRSLLSIDQIGKKMMETALGVLFIDKGCLMLLDQREQMYECITTPPSELKLPAHDPLVQKIAETKKEVTLYDIEEDPLYEKEMEVCKRTFERLEAALIIPLIYEGHLIGLMPLGDKKSGKFYRREDINLLKTLANQGAVAIENARLHQARIEALEYSRKELERLNRAKSIALDHLSHEMKTPLSVIQGSIRLLKRKLQTQTSPTEGEKSFEMLEKQLNRLIDIQLETEKIIQSYQELKEEPISLFSFAERILEKVKRHATHREIHFHLEGSKDLCVLMAPRILEDTLEGLLKNAIENTPDEGMIRIFLEQKDERQLLKVQDYGIGITVENQRHVFEGLFHTQETDLYSSKRPYEFNAGGKGLDLLRMKVYGQRFGFDLSVESQRCIYLPTDRDLCPGKISVCPHCRRPEDCFCSGGSTFSVSFQMTSIKD
jgi:signal transduction histidine kinase